MKMQSMFKTPKYRSFSLKTRYYNAEKEAFELRIKQITAADATKLTEAESVKLRLRDQFQNKRNSRNIYTSKQKNTRIFVIIVILTALSYWILK